VSECTDCRERSMCTPHEERGFGRHVHGFSEFLSALLRSRIDSLGATSGEVLAMYLNALLRGPCPQLSRMNIPLCTCISGGWGVYLADPMIPQNSLSPLAWSQGNPLSQRRARARHSIRCGTTTSTNRIVFTSKMQE
jgi:hypothetical protein